jgi:hypothetical protein
VPKKRPPYRGGSGAIFALFSKPPDISSTSAETCADVRNYPDVWQEAEMRVPCFGALVGLALLSFSFSQARSDQYPVLNVAPVCRGIASQSGLEAGLGTTTFDACVKDEKETREAMIKEWSTFNSDDMAHCKTETTMGGESSYTELVTCLEMSRDVRKMRSETNNSSAPAPEGLPAPVGHRQPTRQ